ncbi:MAG: hypothetical protein ABDH49_04400 [Candidatus Hydrothermales bacterium]
MLKILVLTQLLQPYFNPEFGGVLYLKIQKKRDTIKNDFSFEFNIKGAIDPYFIFFGFFPLTEAGIELEEGYAKTLTLPVEILIGKFRSRFTRLNTFHPHFYDFPELPMMYKHLTLTKENHNHIHPHHEITNHKHEEISGLGIGLSYIFPFKLFIEPGIEVFKGDIGRYDNYIGYLHFSSEIPFNITLWISSFTGIKKDTIKWFGTEIAFKRIKPGEERLRGLLITASYSQNAHFRSFYFDFVFKFIPRWRVGYRFDFLEEENKEQRKNMAMVDFSPTEFSRFRIGYETEEKKVYFEFNFSVGPHGAHPF